MPVAIAYDLVLEDHILARQRVKKRQRPFSRELAEMVRYAVGYRSRAFVTFGAPIPASAMRPAARGREVLELSAPDPRAGSARSSRCCPRALFAAAMRPSITRTDLEQRIDRLIEELAARHANLASPAASRRSKPPPNRWKRAASSSLERGRFRVRERNVLRYYARTIEHLLVTPGRTH